MAGWVSGRKITQDSEGRALSLPLQNFPISDSWREMPLIEMTESQVERFFDELMMLVELEGEIQ